MTPFLTKLYYIYKYKNHVPSVSEIKTGFFSSLTRRQKKYFRIMAIKGRLWIILCEWGYVYALVGRPNERKGMINNLDSEFWFAAPFHDPHTLRRHHHPAFPPVDLHLTRSPYHRQIFSPFSQCVNSYFNWITRCATALLETDAVRHFALLKCSNWRGTQSGSLVKRMQFKSYIFSDGLSGCDLTPVAHHCDPTPFCILINCNAPLTT